MSRTPLLEEEGKRRTQASYFKNLETHNHTLRRRVLLQRNRNPPAVQVVAGTLGQPPHILEPLTICRRLLRVVHKGDRLLILNEFLPPSVELFPFLDIEFKTDLLEEVIRVRVFEVHEIGAASDRARVEDLVLFLIQVG